MAHMTNDEQVNMNDATMTKLERYIHEMSQTLSELKKQQVEEQASATRAHLIHTMTVIHWQMHSTIHELRLEEEEQARVNKKKEWTMTKEASGNADW